MPPALIPLLAPETVAALRARFDPLQRSDVEHEAQGGLGYGLIHYALVSVLRPARVLAIGSRTGFIPACLALALRDVGHGRLDFVDANYSIDTDGAASWDGRGWWTDHSFGELDGVVERALMRTDAFFARQPATPIWGYVHIDGAHDYTTARHDFEQSAARLCQGGLIAMHDSHARKLGVRRVITELGPAWQRMEFPGTWGLTLLQRLG